MAGAGPRVNLDQSLDDIIGESRRAEGGREPSGRGRPSAGPPGRHRGREPKGGVREPKGGGREPKGGGREPKGGGREPKGGGKPGRGGGPREMADHEQAATVLDPADGTFRSWPTWLTGKLIMARRTEVIRTWTQSPCICFRNNQ
jgi:hypothetical protein